ncbi:Transcriptional regulator, AraC family [Pseudomonas chlororaphis subsp. piscium]|uniref:AraC family transcriptional regulator n=1 Tax=Pseudomonas chlororaphis TaxID=587753 RepID=UPI0006A59E98|nr:helix-turn-helix transcriptional regulator [Pseudomonas chlororaphis]AZC30367.1 Transcriptional regulator, AraC family [Pseudomonas chlororaphis subsp. piscium]WDG94282.1 helix-turn-helix transcriptional regulator [Pseudomonas chlororaphis]SDT19374.1 AraC-type DNA-binding protein [Pseudomonas chlororaphis]
MPALHDQHQPQDPDRIDRPLYALRISMQATRWERPWHSHRKAQLLFPLAGVITCETDEGLWMAPPQCAVWIPGDMRHNVRGLERTESYCLFVEPEQVRGLPGACCTLAVSPLLQALLKRCVEVPELYDLDGPQGRLMAVALDELAAAPQEQIHLPMPRHPQLRAMAASIIEQPAERRSLGGWGEQIGMSERNLSRLILAETGLSFGQWQRQLHILLGIKRLARGESVESVALGLGYESASAFIRMFKKAVGQPPARFLAERGMLLGDQALSRDAESSFG